MSPRLFCSLLFLGLLGVSHGQLDRERTRALDALFGAWQTPKGPGGVVGIMDKGEMVYSRAFGMASLEYQVPNAPTTLFNAASVSKQFTALGVVLLYLEGKLDLDRNINDYLSDMPDFDRPITLRQLLHHTSGLRSLHDMLALAGWRRDDLRTNEDLYRFLRQQQDLNFAPNDRYLYSNTGYMLMARIIEQVTGEAFAPWIQGRVFGPLGMVDTYVEDQYDRVVPNNATSYTATGNDFKRAVEYWGYVGSGNMHTTIGDLLVYLANFSEPKKGWEAAFALMLTTDDFNDGTPNPYAFGVRLDTVYGKPRIQHSGSIGGFRAFAASYPQEDVQIALLANFSKADPGQLADAITRIMFNAPEAEAPALPKLLPLRQWDFADTVGDYWDDAGQGGWQLLVQGDSLRAQNKLSRARHTLLPTSKTSFVVLGQPELRYDLLAQNGKGDALRITEKGRPIGFFVPYDSQPETDLSKYSGQFYSEELETIYSIKLRDGKLYSHHMRHGEHPLKWIRKGVFQGRAPLDLIIYTEDPESGAKTLKVSNGRVKNAKFIKVNL